MPLFGQIAILAHEPLDLELQNPASPPSLNISLLFSEKGYPRLEG